MAEDNAKEEAEPGRRFTPLAIAAAAILVIVAAAAIFYFATRAAPPSSTVAAGASPSATRPRFVPSPGSQGAGSRRPQSPEERQSRRGSPGTAGARDSATGSPRPGDGVRPVTSPETLTAVPSPPPSTLAMLDAAHVDTGAVYAIEFAPYGLGPGAGRTLVIAVSSSRPATKMRVTFAFAGRNVLADVSALPAAQRVTKGGRYSGKLRLIPRGGLLAPLLIEAHALK